MRVILSIKPIYTEKILNWEKLYELRKRFSNKEISKVIIYESAPVSRVVWEFDIEEVLCEPINVLWEKTKDYSCVDKKFFDEYYEWKEYWYALKVKNPMRYKKPKLLSEYWKKYPPQSYYFL